MIVHPTNAAIREHLGAVKRFADAIPPEPRDPWMELHRAAMRMAGTAARRAALYGSLDDKAVDEAIHQDREAAADFGRLLAEVEICYAGVTVGQCSACQRLRRMSEPREWEVAANGGSGLAAECLYCHATVAVADRRAGRTQKKVAADGAATPTTAGDAA